MINYNSYRLFQNENDEQYLYLIDNNSIFLLDEKAEEMLKFEGMDYDGAYKKVSDKMSEAEFQRVFEAMKDIGLVASDKVKDSRVVNEKFLSPMGVTLMIVQECNLRCTYCYGEGGEYQDKGKMSLAIAKKSIDFLVSNTKGKELLVCFLGGEPLMNFPLIQAIVKYCEIYESNKKIHFKYTVTTNGTIWNTKIENFFRDKHFSVQISIDGEKEVHNCNRFYPNGAGSFDVMEKNTRGMRIEGLLSGRATITSTNLDLTANFKVLNNMNFKSIPMAPAQNLLTEVDYERLIEENKKLIQYFSKLIKEGKYKTAKKIRILMSGLYKIHKSGVPRNIPCGVGSTTFAVDINGNVYPCHRFVANKEYSMGNVLRDVEMRNTSFLEEINVLNHSDCKKCWAKNLCAGACPNENLVNMGTTKKSDKKNCRFIQAMYEDLIHAYLELTTEHKKKLFG